MSCEKGFTDKAVPVTIRFDTIRYDSIQYNAIWYNAIQYDVMQYNTIHFIVPMEEICFGLQMLPTFLCLSK